MGKFGDERSILTWVMYVRWPLFGFALAFIGAIVGAFFGSIMGALMGFGGGLVMGVILGLVMGKDKNMFPVTIERWVKYGGDFPKLPQRFVGRVNVRQFPQENAPPVEDVRVEYLDGMTIRRIPNFGPPVWSNENGKPILKVVQVDRLIYLPMSAQGGRLTIHRAPVYRMVEALDKNGNKTLVYARFKAKRVQTETGAETMEFEKDAEGNLVPDPAGEVWVDHYEDATVIDFNKMQDLDGKVIDIPIGMAAKLNNDRAEFTQAWSIMASMYKMGGFWEKYGGMIIFLVAVAGTLLAAYWFYDSANGNFRLTTELQRQISGQIAEQNVEAARLNAQIASALLKAGFNYNTSFVYGPLVVNGTGSQVTATPGGQLKIPFIS